VGDTPPLPPGKSEFDAPSTTDELVTDSAAIIFVHGLFSKSDTWNQLCRLIASDIEFAGLGILHFSYPSPKVRFNPLRAIPDFNLLADNLQTFMQIEAAEFKKIILISHSQGGLIVQRFLERMLNEGRGRELARIGRVVMLACPNEGSQVFLLIRGSLLFWRHPQERELRPINDAIVTTRKVVINRVVHADELTATSCPIDVLVYAGESDNIVTPASARSVFPKAGVIPGDHFTILRADSPSHRTYTTIKWNIREALRNKPDSPLSVASESSPTSKTLSNSHPGVRPFDKRSHEPDSTNDQVLVRVPMMGREITFIVPASTAFEWIRKLGQSEEGPDGWE
jgi:pimeloyl-ACP methyl ester carboxylesterase